MLFLFIKKEKKTYRFDLFEIPNSSAVERTTVNRDVLGSNPNWGVFLLQIKTEKKYKNKVQKAFGNAVL